MDHVGPGRMRGPEPHGAFLNVTEQGLGPSILTKDLKSEVERKLSGAACSSYSAECSCHEKKVPLVTHDWTGKSIELRFLLVQDSFKEK